MSVVPQAQALSFEEKKDADEMLDHKDAIEHEEVGTPDLVSHFANMPRGQAIRKFWRVFLIWILITSAGM